MVNAPVGSLSAVPALAGSEAGRILTFAPATGAPSSFTTRPCKVTPAPNAEPASTAIRAQTTNTRPWSQDANRVWSARSHCDETLSSTGFLYYFTPDVST